MYAKESDKGIRLSVCDPNLNIEEKTYTTKEPSRPITKEIRLKGHWTLTSVNKAKADYECGRKLTVYISPDGGAVASSELINGGDSRGRGLSEGQGDFYKSLPGTPKTFVTIKRDGLIRPFLLS